MAQKFLRPVHALMDESRNKQLRLELGLLVLIKEENQSNFGLDFVTIGNQYDVLKTGENGSFVTKDQLRT